MNIEEAIEIVKGITENDLLNYWEGPEEPYDAIQTVLNLITKQSKEIEELRKKNEPQPDCEEPTERTEEMVNMKWVNYNYISKDEIRHIRDKAECMDYYSLNDVIDDLTKIIGE